MEPIVQLANQYRTEFEQDFQEIRRRAVSAQKEITEKAQSYQKQAHDLEPILKKGRDDVVSWLQDQSPIGDLDKARLMGTFAWTSVLLFGASIGGIFGWILSPILGLFVSSFYAFIAAYIALPGAAFYFLQKPAEENKEGDQMRRHSLLAFALLQGLLTGFLLSDRVLAGPPPLAALTPLAIGLGAQIGASVIASDRKKLLGVALGGGFAVHVLVGALLGLSVPYILLALLYTATGFAALQLYIKNAGKGAGFTHVYQLSFVCAVIVCQLVVYGLLGGEADEIELVPSE